MKRLFDVREHFENLRQLVQWTLLVLPVAILSGSASALFLWALDHVTRLRWEQTWLLYLLPVAGVAVGWVYHRFGKRSEAGNNLIMEEIHQPGGGVPARMAPLVLVGTLLTHLCGGSAGREGTAVQMGGSLAGAFGRLAKLSAENRRMLLMAGVAAGFGSVFGTPLAGAIFAMEVLVIGHMRYDALIPVLVASLVGDFTCSAWGIQHTPYHIAFDGAEAGHSVINGLLLGKIVLAAMLFGLVSQGFAEFTHLIKTTLARWIPYAPLRPAVGGAVVIALVFALGTRDYLGIGVSSPDPEPSRSWPPLTPAVRRRGAGGGSCFSRRSRSAPASRVARSRRCSSSAPRSATPLPARSACPWICSPGSASSRSSRAQPTLPSPAP